MSVCQTHCSSFLSLLHAGCGIAVGLSHGVGTKTHGSTEPPLWTWHGDGHKGQCSCFWATLLCCCLVFSLWYITVLPKTTQPQNLWSHLVQDPPTAGPPGEDCSEPYPAVFRDGDDIPLRMRRCVNTQRQAGHSFSEETYNYTYFQYQILDNKKGAYSLPSTFTL